MIYEIEKLAPVTLRDLAIFMGYTGPVCQVSGHQKSICPVFTVREKSRSRTNTVIGMQQLKMF